MKIWEHFQAENRFVNMHHLLFPGSTLPSAGSSGENTLQDCVSQFTEFVACNQVHLLSMSMKRLLTASWLKNVSRIFSFASSPLIWWNVCKSVQSQAQVALNQ